VLLPSHPALLCLQDITFFDTQASTGGLLQGLNEDSLAVKEAISEKVCLVVMCRSAITMFVMFLLPAAAFPAPKLVWFHSAIMVSVMSL
jgi:ABC-type multidrug transport system fused ATPase/permease subunit